MSVGQIGLFPLAVTSALPRLSRRLIPARLLQGLATGTTYVNEHPGGTVPGQVDDVNHYRGRGFVKNVAARQSAKKYGTSTLAQILWSCRCALDREALTVSAENLAYQGSTTGPETVPNNFVI